MTIKCSIHIPAPRTLVWNIAQNPLLRTKWDVRVDRYTVDPVPQKSASVTMRLNFFGIHMDILGHLVHFDVPVQSALSIDSIHPPFFLGGGGTWKFEETNEETFMTSCFTLKPKKWGFLYQWYCYPLIKWDTMRSLNRLKELVLKQTSKTPAIS